MSLEVMNHLQEYREISNKVWGAFEQAERFCTVKVWDLKKQLHIREELKEYSNEYYRHYPIYQLLGLFCFFAAMFCSSKKDEYIALVILIIYSFFVILSIKSRREFIRKYCQYNVKKNDIISYGFGVENVSFLIFKMMSFYYEKGGSNLNSNVLDSIIKTQKTLQEYKKTGTGIYDYLHKASLAFLVSIPLVAQEYFKKNEMSIKYFYKNMHDFLWGNTIIFFGVMTLLFIAIIFFYEFLIGYKMSLKQKAKYLHCLTVLRESYNVKAMTSQSQT